MERTKAKLRRTFKYPEDNDSDDSLPDVLDEEEQESLIRTLYAQNRARNTQYKTLFLAVPLLAAFPYLPPLFHARTALLSLLSLTSLLSTACLTHILPAEQTSIAFLDNLHTPSSPSQLSRRRFQDAGPVQTYLPYLNLVLVAVLGVLGAVSSGRGREVVWVGFGWVPGVVYGVVLVAKVVMAGVDPEAELGGLRYRFKGA